MSSIKSFIKKAKEKTAQYKEKQDNKKAESKGFSSAKSYDFYKNTAKTRGEEKGKSKLRKQELKRIEQEAQQDVMLGRTGKYNKFQKKVKRGFETFEKGAGVYNEIMGGLQSLGSGNDSFYPQQNTKQAYASGYGLYPPEKKRRKAKTKQKPKTKKRSKPRKPRSFMDQFMQY